MKKELSIMVWDVIFYTEDEDGNPTTDKNGNLIKYRADIDCSSIAEGVDLEDLEAIEEVEEVDINQLKLEL